MKPELFRRQCKELALDEFCGMYVRLLTIPNLLLQKQRAHIVIIEMQNEFSTAELQKVSPTDLTIQKAQELYKKLYLFLI